MTNYVFLTSQAVAMLLDVTVDAENTLSYLSSWTAQPLAMTGPPEALQQIWPKYLPVQTMDCILTYHHYYVILCVLYLPHLAATWTLHVWCRLVLVWCL